MNTPDGVVRDGKLGTADLLTPKQVANRFDGGVLIIKIRFKVQFHVGVDFRRRIQGELARKTDKVAR
jgi:hypothetical protein